MFWAKVIPLSGVHCTSILELYLKIIFFTMFSPSFHQVFTKFSPSSHQIFTNFVGPGEFPFITILHSEDQDLLRLPHHRQLPVHHVWQSKHNKTNNYQTINHNCKHFSYNQIINYKNFNYNYNNYYFCSFFYHIFRL